MSEDSKLYDICQSSLSQDTLAPQFGVIELTENSFDYLNSVDKDCYDEDMMDYNGKAFYCLRIR